MEKIDELTKWQQLNSWLYWKKFAVRSFFRGIAMKFRHRFDKSIAYRFTQEMGEISGFGGGYEITCREMLNAALVWFDENPAAEPKFQGYKGIYGIITEDNEDAQALSKVVVDAAHGDCTGAMHQAVVSSALWIKTNGWDAYVKEMSSRK